MAINQNSIKDSMIEAHISGASIATFDSANNTSMSTQFGFTEQNGSDEITKDTKFQCASLSKPVFAYLVLKLIAMNSNKAEPPNKAKPRLGQFNTEFDLNTPLYTVFRDKKGEILPRESNPFLKKFHFDHHRQAKELTAKMVLSHTTGLRIMDQEPYKFQFKPGECYSYSGIGIKCLQGAIEELTGANLEILAQANVFGPAALNMPHSTYGAEPNAANSLQTTAEEYIKFIIDWINDDTLNYAFTPVAPADSMKNDYLPYSKDKLVENIIVQKSDREHVAWGLGVGLVKNEHNQVLGAYHTGDMNQWRAGFGAEIDPISKRCTGASVYLANSHNGHILAEQVLPSILKPALNYFFSTYGFAQSIWELDRTNFHGLNPKILKQELKEVAYNTQVKEMVHNTKTDTQNMAPPAEPESSEEKRGEKYNPFSTTPKPPWK